MYTFDGTVIEIVGDGKMWNHSKVRYVLCSCYRPPPTLPIPIQVTVDSNYLYDWLVGLGSEAKHLAIRHRILFSALHKPPERVRACVRACVREKVSERSCVPVTATLVLLNMWVLTRAMFALCCLPYIHTYTYTYTYTTTLCLY